MPRHARQRQRRNNYFVASLELLVLFVAANEVDASGRENSVFSRGHKSDNVVARRNIRGILVDGRSRSIAEPKTVEVSNMYNVGIHTTISSDIRGQLEATSIASLTNILINALRPDPWIPWPARLPRILWEAAIHLTCRLTMIASMSSASGSDGSRTIVHLLLLATMTLCTAIVDIFVWAPIASASVRWERCTGGELLWFGAKQSARVCQPDYITGYGRVLVTIQCMVTGVIYLSTAVAAFDASRRLKQNEKLHLQQQMLHTVIGSSNT